MLGKFGKVDEIIGMSNPYHYRNKVQSAFYTDPRSHKIISGIYQSSTHRIVGMDSCMIEDKKADEIIVSVRKLLKDFKLTTYNEVTGKGFLRHVLVKRGFATNEIMVVLVTGTPIFTAKYNFCKALLKIHPEITTIIQNVNDKYTSMLLGQNEKVLYGPGYIVDECCGLKFRISAKSFYQINPVQTEKLYGKAMEFANLKGGEKVIDAYCGIGTIGMIAASKVSGKNPVNVIGVELNSDAVKDAKQNAQLNNMKNIRFYNADATEFISEMAVEGEKVDVVLMDPPRAGSTEEFILSVCSLAPKKVVYISCNPETLARDLLTFTANGYKAQKIQPVDMFPMTQHVETVCLLVRRNGLHIDIDVDVEEMLQEKRGQATYPQIRDYVLEQTGLKVSSLYISQVKRKCGLDVGENYNKPKSENSKQPQCPPEKEEAIMSALRHFGVI